MALALADGRALLTIENRDSGGRSSSTSRWRGPASRPCPSRDQPNGLRRRRGRLLAANLLVDAAPCWPLAQGTALPAGLTRLRPAVREGPAWSSAGTRDGGGREADFKARLRLGAGTGRQVRISVEDIRVQGTPPWRCRRSARS